MTAYIIRRLLQLPITVFGVTVLIFAMTMVLSPVERSALYVRDFPHTEGALDAIIRRYGLADPFHVQYWRWLVGRTDPETGKTVGGVLRGDLGFSRSGRQPVMDYILHRLPASVELALWSVVPIIGVGIWLGILAAIHHNRFIPGGAGVWHHRLVIPHLCLCPTGADDLLRQAALVSAGASLGLGHLGGSIS